MKRGILALLVVSSTASAQTAPPADVYVLAGQSNMSGRGAIEDLTAAERTADPRIRLYGNDGVWHDARDPLDDATGQIDAVSADRQAAVGPGLFFARAMVRLRGRPVVLVPCAKGGSAIARWKPGGDRTTLYGSCLARIREAGGHVAGVLWYQGETDAETPGSDVATWTAAFERIAGALRADLAAPRLPIVIVRIADRPRVNAERYPGWAWVQAQQARSSLPCTRVVPAGGMPRKPDDLHLSTPAQRMFGPKLATAMNGLISNACR